MDKEREREGEGGGKEREMLSQGVRLQMVSDLFFQSKKKGEFDLGAVSEQSTFFSMHSQTNK